MKNRGVTLVELLVALAVVAILSAVAWPGYAAVMKRAHRQDARLALMQVQHRQERHYLRHLQYSGDTGGSPGDESPRLRSDSGNYRLYIRLREGGQGYVAHAVPDPRGRQAADNDCARFSIDETGRRWAENAAGGDSTALCWG